jgi:hypothetical protein
MHRFAERTEPTTDRVTIEQLFADYAERRTQPPTSIAYVRCRNSQRKSAGNRCYGLCVVHPPTALIMSTDNA